MDVRCKHRDPNPDGIQYKYLFKIYSQAIYKNSLLISFYETPLEDDELHPPLHYHIM